MTTALIGVIVINLLIIRFIANYRAIKSAKEQRNNATRATIMVGIDIILIVLIIVTLLLKYM
ncbi:hypothetical protein B8A11_10635 [Staphylococcus aureus]|uniref:hypothetical protein n=1 Tax=Staphylococcus aureus TaxID=1280 RepID=UPI000A0F567B|nr:hypothetical protein [Staphylococcus aureus]ORN97748.1 hypothetical protein B8A11_10635 [Staphylococcus aureus]